ADNSDAAADHESGEEAESYGNTPPDDGAGEDPVPDALVGLFAQQGALESLNQSNDATRPVPRVLLDGADSVGAWAAFSRVYLNIGSYYERWIQIHQPVTGFTPQKPFRIEDCEDHSVYWNATDLRVGPLRDYFLKITPPMSLLRTPDGDQRVRTEPAKEIAAKKGIPEETVRATTVDLNKLKTGRRVFAENCIVCHSSIQPESSEFLYSTEGGEESERHQHHTKWEGLIKRRLHERQQWAADGEFWEHSPGQWLSDPAYEQWAKDIVENPLFWKLNYLSTDYRIAVTDVQTNSARAMATNGMTGHMWEDFSSESYRNMPSVPPMEFFNPYAGENGEWQQYSPRHKTAPGIPEGGGGPGFYRVPSLVSIWTSAPLLHNNSLGEFNNDPSVDGRLLAFDDAIRKLLWPEKRLESSSYNDATPERLKRDNGLIWRTTQESSLTVAGRYVPNTVRLVPWLSGLTAKYPALRRIQPLWLPGVVLLFASFVLFSRSGVGGQRRWGILLLLGAAAIAVLYLLSHWYSIWRCLQFCEMQIPWWIPVIGIAFAGLLLVVPLSRTIRAIAGAGLLTVSVLGLLACTGVLAVILLWFRQIYPWWLPVATLAIAGLLLLVPRSDRFHRAVGYVALGLSILFTTTTYFLAGKTGTFAIGPIPKGTPVNLLANFNSEADRGEIIRTLTTVADGLSEIQSRHLSEADAQNVMKQKIAPALMSVNKSPDFIMDRGHDFAWFSQMTDEDKEALIELLKTM
ncbi:MAG: phage holin family protein, partial [Planctomycetaceae bacterium]|nr:phage holin family protein [Planctomycetaceae bacterium]